VHDWKQKRRRIAKAPARANAGDSTFGHQRTESVFSLQGIGKLAVTAVDANDLPMLLGVTMVAAGAIVFFNIIVDAVYAFIDPRIRLA